MKKTPVVFVMDHEKDLLTPQIRKGLEWVLAGEGVATVKFDGQATLWKAGRLWKRYDRKLNKAAQRRWDRGQDLGEIQESLFKTPPEGFEPCEPTPDPVSFHWPGWVPISDTDPADQWHREALSRVTGFLVEGQTYELVGPTLARNIYCLAHHQLWRHGQEVVDLPVRSFDTIGAFLAAHAIEGLVFHHPDGRMAKIRKKDFKLFWVQEDLRSPPRRRPAP